MEGHSHGSARKGPAQPGLPLLAHAAAACCLLILVLLLVCLAPKVALAAEYGLVYSSLDGHAYGYDPSTGSRVRLGPKPRDEMHWSPDGSRAVGFDRRRTVQGDYEWLDVRLLRRSDASETVLRNEHGSVLPHRMGHVTFAGWSADGSRFALKVMKKLTENEWNSRLYVVDARTGRAIASLACVDSSDAALSPDATQVVYADGTTGDLSLRMWDVASGATTPWLDGSELAHGEGGADTLTPLWPSRGDRLVVSIGVGFSIHNRHVATIDLVTKSVAFVPAASPWAYDVTPDGRHVLLQTQSSDQYAGMVAMGLYDSGTNRYRELLSPRQTVESAEISADGAGVAYISGNFDLSHRSAKVTLIDLSTGKRRAVAKGWDAAWVPASSVRAQGAARIAQPIAFVRDSYIWSVRPDGSGMQRMTRGESPAWSPDGQRMAFIRTVAEHKTRICTVSASGGSSHVLAYSDSLGPVDVRYAESLAYSPDGRRLAIAETYWTAGGYANHCVTLVDLATRKGEVLIKGVLALDAQWRLSWSPDGKTIIVGERGQSWTCKGWLLDTSAGSLTGLETPDVFSGDWSPTGARILVSTMTGRRTTISLATPAGKVIRQLASGTGEDGARTGSIIGEAGFSPDGRQVVYISQARSTGRRSLWIMNRDGGGRHLLTTGESPAWSW